MPMRCNMWVSEGLMNGTDAATFSPDAPMSRAMLVTVLYRLSGEPAVSQDSGFADVASDAYYADAENISDYAAEAMSWCVENGIRNGTDGGRLAPADSATRAETAAVLQRFAAL